MIYFRIDENNIKKNEICKIINNSTMNHMMKITKIDKELHLKLLRKVFEQFNE